MCANRKMSHRFLCGKDNLLEHRPVGYCLRIRPWAVPMVGGGHKSNAGPARFHRWPSRCEGPPTNAEAERTPLNDRCPATAIVQPEWLVGRTGGQTASGILIARLGNTACSMHVLARVSMPTLAAVPERGRQAARGASLRASLDRCGRVSGAAALAHRSCRSMWLWMTNSYGGTFGHSGGRAAAYFRNRVDESRRPMAKESR
jgi:hypothetical protein